MITIGYSTRTSNPQLQEYFKKSCGHPKVEVIEKVNPNGKSLTEVYNEILNESSNDIVVLCHDDIYFEKNGWGNKIIKHFDKTDYGILGVAGTTYLPKSGMWWEDRSKMYGVVNHEHEGKKWESKYSDSLGNDIQQTVLVDGLFIVIHKKRIKETFNEEVKGFHLYDVDFCFRNYLHEVKIGVLYNIRLTHKSIGMTNEEWEKNRILFSEKWSDYLPVKITKKPGEKLKILIGCLFFKTFTGSEVYVYELAKGLVSKGHEVTVMSEIGGPLTDLAKRAGIKCVSVQDAPGYKLGDGKWVLNTPNGPQPSQPNMYYKISEVKFDIIHCQHEPITNLMCNLYPNIEKVSTIHSEVIDLEKPVINDTIKKYISIRPEIRDYIHERYDVSFDNIEVIYNPIDDTRFTSKKTNEENSILFVGTIDYLREKTILDLVEYTKENSMELWLVGENKSEYLQTILENNHVKHYKSTWNTESYIHRCKETAGILLGRTTIEGWMCGKNGWIYDVDSNGDILSKKLHEIPEDLDKFKSSNVVEHINELYYEVIS